MAMTNSEKYKKAQEDILALDREALESAVGLVEKSIEQHEAIIEQFDQLGNEALTDQFTGMEGGGRMAVRQTVSEFRLRLQVLRDRHRLLTDELGTISNPTQPPARP